MISGPYYRLHCDGPGCAQCEDFDTPIPHRLDQITEAAQKAGWTVNVNLHLCPKCTEADR